MLNEEDVALEQLLRKRCRDFTVSKCEQSNEIAKNANMAL